MTLLTVGLPVYNAMPYLPEAVNSILRQDYSDFILVMINDGSTDASRAYLESLTDSRIRLYHQDNRGLGDTLNRILESCDAKYLARMDADDVMEPTRLEEQLKYMEQHDDVVMLGTQLAFIAGGRIVRAPCVPIAHKDINARLMIGSSGVCHPSLMLRTQAVKAIGGYRIEGAGEDLDFCLRLCEIGQVANLDRVLHYYRIHENSLALNKQDEIRRGYAYAIACAKCRRQSLAEPKFEDFVESWNKRNTLDKNFNKIQDWADRQYRRSILDKGHGRILRSVTRLLCAAAMRPRYSMKKLLNKW